MFRKLVPLALALGLAACTSTPSAERMSMLAAPGAQALNPGETPEVRALVNKWADYYQVPRSLVHSVIQRESDYRAEARNGPYYGMLQILPQTARGMGMEGGPEQLLSADKALKYSLRYLRGAWMVSGGDEHEAMMWYARGYYYEAKRLNLLAATGLRGGLWRDYDRGAAAMPGLDAVGHVLPDAPPCQPARGLARMLGGDGCA